MTTKGQSVAADIAALLRARNSLLWVTTKEEKRVESYLFQAAAKAGYIARFWDAAQGVTELDGSVSNADLADVDEMFKYIRTQADSGMPTVWILRDLPVWLEGVMFAKTLRMLRNLARYLSDVPLETRQAIIVLTPSSTVPAELSNHCTLIDWPLPDRGEIAVILDDCIAAQPEARRDNVAPNGQREAAIDASIGLSGEEVEACLAKSLVQTKRIDPVVISQEKKRVIAKSGLLEWIDPLPGGLDSVGGLDVLKMWLKQRALAYSKEARAYGLPAPKGALLVGIPGCGKSLSAKAVATAYGIPLLRMDLGALKSKFVGESEQNLRKAFATLESINRCVVWIDEIEKALAGATQGAADGGVSSDALGTLLSWMQDRKSEAFVIATANDVSALPPELLRKGRFDEVFFVDLPNVNERVEILRAALNQFKIDPATIALKAVADKCEGFTGSEIAALVPDAMFAAFSDGARQINAADLTLAGKSIVPLSVTMEKRITALRDWANTRARKATSALTLPTKSQGRKLDIED